LTGNFARIAGSRTGKTVQRLKLLQITFSFWEADQAVPEIAAVPFPWGHVRKAPPLQSMKATVLPMISLFVR
jgi:hypothetical protein